ncbi:hypothetical protein Barb4_01137 [Bacteroidales bacterium Barb4]|nr:hypothetical protein Barb4_01137 [Bacteroidales bacterium Barb4]
MTKKEIGKTVRQRKKKNKPYRDISERIGRLHDKLRRACPLDAQGYHSPYDHEDVFQETVIHVMHDIEARNKTDDEFINWFLYRYSMILFQTIKDIKQLKEIPYYANNQQAQEQEAENE